MQAFFFRPGPPYRGMSIQNGHFPQFGDLQPSHNPHLPPVLPDVEQQHDSVHSLEPPMTNLYFSWSLAPSWQRW